MLRNTSVLLLLASLAGHPAAAEIPVTVDELGELLVVREFRAPASVVAANRTVVTSQVTALIEDMAADVGNIVSEGDLLARLNAADARLALAGAEAELAALNAQIADARRRLERAENLVESDFVSDDELNARRTEVDVLEANLQQQSVAIRNARLTLGRTEIRAPYDAAVAERQGQVGDLATPGSPLFTLVQLDGREVDAQIDPRHAERLPGTSTFRFVSQRAEWTVELTRLSPVIEEESRKMRARFRFLDGSAAVGATGELVWSEPSAFLPVRMIVQRERQLGFFTVTDGRARFVPLPFAQEGRPAEVNLPGDTPVVTGGQARLQDGDAVQITEE